MSKVIVALSMSLDGFIAGASDDARNALGKEGAALFDWYFNGDTPSQFYAAAERRGVPVPPFKLTRENARVFEELVESLGAVVTGRRTYDIVNGWEGNGPQPGVPLFVVTHKVPKTVPKGESHYTFVTDGAESAIRQAKAVAGDKYVGLMGSAVPQAALRAGLLDEILIHLAPVLLGSGVRLFDHLGSDKVGLEVIKVVSTPSVTHLRYRVVK